ncbi:hypothetical protein MMC18_006747 [Xylographa bjoerkii]|nr:hypothetical protein [Xylographa bjoerkii]
MATEEDNFDIDIYGDGGEDYQEEGQVEPEEGNQTTQEPVQPSESAIPPPGTFVGSAEPKSNGHGDNEGLNSPKVIEQADNVPHKIGSTDESVLDPLNLPKQAPQAQGLKRKEGIDDRFVDPGATTALFISDLHWWITDDDIRGWANQSECEDELEDMTFSEHKVNGKSKGQAYVLFKSPQAATAAKHKIESFGEGQKYRQKFTVSYTNPYTNPFKTLPKDGPLRNGNQGNRSSSGGYSNSSGIGATPSQQSSYSANSGYRGRGGYNNRGGMSNIGGYNRGGFQQAMPGGYQTPPMNGFQAPPMGGMPSYGGFQNRGGMMGGMRGNPMGMRGGRGTMNPNGMMGMPMGGMNMGGIQGPMGGMGGMGMTMPQMGAGMGMQGMRNHVSPSTGFWQTPLPSALYPQISFHSSARSTMSASTSPLPPAIGPAAYPHATSGTSLYLSAAPTAIPAVEDTQVPSVDTTLKRKAYDIGSPGFQGAQPHYNSAFFPQQPGQAAAMGDSSWNPHGAKRTRQE